jgi:hypothetical protein
MRNEIIMKMGASNEKLDEYTRNTKANQAKGKQKWLTKFVSHGGHFGVNIATYFSFPGSGHEVIVGRVPWSFRLGNGGLWRKVAKGVIPENPTGFRVSDFPFSEELFAQPG